MPPIFFLCFFTCKFFCLRPFNVAASRSAGISHTFVRVQTSCVKFSGTANDRHGETAPHFCLGLEPPPAGADKTVKMHPTDIPWYDYIGRKDPITGEITCPWRRGRGKVPSGGSSGVQMAG